MGCETIQTGVGKCTGTNLPEGSECWSETYSSGECASGLSCINNVCTVFTDNPSCLESGITGSNLCYLGALSETVNKPCCNPAPSGSTNVWCLPSSDTSVTDKFCMEYNIEEDQACGTTEAFGYIGYCKGSLECQNGVVLEQQQLRLLLLLQQPQQLLNASSLLKNVWMALPAWLVKEDVAVDQIAMYLDCPLLITFAHEELMNFDIAFGFYIIFCFSL